MSDDNTSSADGGLRDAIANAVATGTPAATPAPSADVDYRAEAEKWKALSRQNEAQAKANASAAKRLADIEESQKTEVQKLADAKAAAEKAAVDAQAQLLRYTVSAATGVPADLLVGATEEELTAHAEKLLAFSGKTPGKPAAPDLGQGNRGPATAGDPNSWLRAAARRTNI